MRALIFEADLSAGRWLESLLSQRGHEVGVFPTADAAARGLTNGAPDLLVLDWMAQESVALCRRARAGGSGLVILASVLTDAASEIEAALSAGADNVLPKFSDAAAFTARLAWAETLARERVQRERWGAELRRVRSSAEVAIHRAQVLFEVVGDMVVAVSPEGLVEALNPGFLSRTGWSLSEWKGEPAGLLFHGADREQAKLFLAAALAGRRAPTTALRFLTKSLGVLETLADVVPLRGEKGTEGALLVARALTQSAAEAEEVIDEVGGGGR